MAIHRLLVTAILASGAPESASVPEASRPVWDSWMRMLECAAIEADFKVTPVGDRANKACGGETGGHWSVRLRPLYAERVSFRLELEDAAAQFVECSYDDGLGEGRVLRRAEDVLTGTGVLSADCPDEMGTAYLPSSTNLLTVGYRPLRDGIASGQLLVGDESDGRLFFFVVAANEDVLFVYILGDDPAKPVLEVRCYTRESFSPGIVRNERLGPQIPLPPGYANATLFARRVVTKWLDIDGRPIPTAWELHHSVLPPGETIRVELDGPTVTVSTQTNEAVQVAWPEGTMVFDATQAKTFWVGPQGSRHRGEVIAEAKLTAILAACGRRIAAVEGAEAQSVTPTSCAANAVYLCLSMLGKNVPLREIFNELHRPGTEAEASLQDMVQVCEGRGLRCRAVTTDRGFLRRLTRSGAILHTRQKRQVLGFPLETVQHFVVACDFDESSDTVRVLDPPRLPYAVSVNDLTEVWTGHAMIWGSTVDLWNRYRSRRTWTMIALGVVAAGCCIIGVGICRSSRKTGRRSAATTASLAIVVSCIHGCEGRGDQELRAAKRSDVVVFDGTEHDLGEIPPDAAKVEHCFRLQNVGTRMLRITRVRKSCGCLVVKVDPKVIRPGDFGTACATMETIGLAGPKAVGISLELNDGEVEPVALQIRGMITREYLVAICPRNLAVRLSELEAGPVVKEVEATEFISRRMTDGTGFLRDAEVTSLSPNVRIVNIGEWEALGWTVRGFARSTRVQIMIEGLRSGASDYAAELRFSRSVDSNSGPDQVICVPLTIRAVAG